MKTPHLLQRFVAFALIVFPPFVAAATAATSRAHDASGLSAEALAKAGTVSAASLKLEGTGFYLDQGKWAAINPDQRKEASVKFTVPAANGRYRVTLHAVGENGGNSWYEVVLGGHSLGTFTCQPSKEMFEEGPSLTKSNGNVAVSQGESVLLATAARRQSSPIRLTLARLQMDPDLVALLAEPQTLRVENALDDRSVLYSGTVLRPRNSDYSLPGRGRPCPATTS